MDKFSLPKTFDHRGFLRFYLAVECVDAISAGVWIEPLNALITEFSEDELEMISDRVALDSRLQAHRRTSLMELDRRVRGSRHFGELDLAITDFERRYFCESENGGCVRCGRPSDVGGPLCSSRFGAPETKPEEPVSVAVDPAPKSAQPESVPGSDPLLEYFKIAPTPGEIGGFEYDALIDSAPVVVWRPACEIERDFVDDLLCEAETAGITRLFLIARTDLGPDKLPTNPKVALILLPIPPDFGAPLMNVIETDVAYS